MNSLATINSYGVVIFFGGIALIMIVAGLIGCVANDAKEAAKSDFGEQE